MFLQRNDEDLEVEDGISIGATSSLSVMKKILPSKCLGLQIESTLSPRNPIQKILLILEDLLVQDDTSIGGTSFSAAVQCREGSFVPLCKSANGQRTPLSVIPIQKCPRFPNPTASLRRPETDRARRPQPMDMPEWRVVGIIALHTNEINHCLVVVDQIYALLPFCVLCLVCAYDFLVLGGLL